MCTKQSYLQDLRIPEFLLLKPCLNYVLFEFIQQLSWILAELAECNPIIIQNSSNPSSRKNLDIRPYDRTTVQGATFNMRG